MNREYHRFQNFIRSTTKRRIDVRHPDTLIFASNQMQAGNTLWLTKLTAA